MICVIAYHTRSGDVDQIMLLTVLSHKEKLVLRSERLGRMSTLEYRRVGGVGFFWVFDFLNFWANIFCNVIYILADIYV